MVTGHWDGTTWMAAGHAAIFTRAPPLTPAPITRLRSILLWSVLLWLVAPSVAQTVAPIGTTHAVTHSVSPAAVPVGKNSTKPPHVHTHLVPVGTTLEDCRKHPGLCQPLTCELWRDDIKDRCACLRTPLAMKPVLILESENIQPAPGGLRCRIPL